MSSWQQQGAAWVRSLQLTDGSAGKAVVVAERGNPKGVQLVIVGADGKAKAVQLSQLINQLSPCQVIDILCFQERAFGDGRLPAVAD